MAEQRPEPGTNFSGCRLPAAPGGDGPRRPAAEHHLYDGGRRAFPKSRYRWARAVGWIEAKMGT